MIQGSQDSRFISPFHLLLWKKGYYFYPYFISIHSRRNWKDENDGISERSTGINNPVYPVNPVKSF